MQAKTRANNVPVASFSTRHLHHHTPVSPCIFQAAADNRRPGRRRRDWL